MAELVLGIDTGGTYTDGVLLDRRSREVLASTKTLTTHHDLKECIITALDVLLPKDSQSIKLVAISTTLATNAIAEGKGRPVALFLLGYDPDLIRKFNFETNFATPYYYYFRGGHDIYAQEQDRLDLEAITQKVSELNDKVEAFAISGYFSPFNPSHEEQAFEVVVNLTDLPVVLGHQLASKLNSIQRATTATLNASLLSILKDFIKSMHQALDERGVTTPLMVVRGDGALMSWDVANRLPVETVHSGPASSAIGGRFLSGKNKALVIDIGGTTTDIAVIDRGGVTIREEGTTVGDYSTAVRAANVRSIGLGGDSIIGLDLEDRLTIGPERVTPISYLADHDPRVAKDLQRFNYESSRRHSLERLEYWYLQREPQRFISNDRTRQVVDLLRTKPMTLPEILDRMGLFHPLQFGGRSLIREDIIGRAALTPTDLLHLNGMYSPWDVESAEIAAKVFCRLKGWSVKELTNRVLIFMAERIVKEIVTFISGQSLNRTPSLSASGSFGSWIFEESLYRKNPYLGSKIYLKVPIIGIGAPAKIFLPRVAELLHTELIVPPYYQVANAVGAVVGSVMMHQEAWVFPQTRGLNVVGYYVQAGGKRKRFSELESAINYARKTVGNLALMEAKAAGAVEPKLDFEELPDGAESYRLRVRAIGRPRLGDETR